MYVDRRRFLRDSFRGLFFPSEQQLRIDGHRARVLVMFYLCMAWMGGSGRLGYLLDRLLFRRALRTRVSRPVFIIGNFRTGSSFLFRLLAEDQQTFAAMKTWEIYFAPSISQRKFYTGLWMVDRWFGAPLRRWISRTSEQILSRVKLHRIRLGEAEEDEALLLYLWSSLFNWFFMPVEPDTNPFPYFDQAVPRWRQDAVMGFYRGCVTRHVAAHARSGASPVYLAKNPAFSGKIRSLLRTFPDARFIYLIRNPVDTANSTGRWLTFAWKYFSSLDNGARFAGAVLRMVKHWYTYPRQALDGLGPDRVAWIRFEDLVDRPERTIRELYGRFNLGCPGASLAGLDAAAAREKSEVEAPADDRPLGLSRAALEELLAPEMAAWGYPRGG